jgi:hypothetical protein
VPRILLVFGPRLVYSCRDLIDYRRFFVVKQVIIENPVINSPYKEPCRHFRFSEETIADEIIEVKGEKKKGIEAKVSTARHL